MPRMSSYSDYVVDKAFLESYNAYQAKYASQIPERDKVTLRIIAGLTGGKSARLLDIGCSTGNLLAHIRRALPHLELAGGELAEPSLAVARQNPELQSVRLEKMDMLEIRDAYDIIVSNAVTYLFDDRQFEAAARSVQRALQPGGAWIDFDWFSPFRDQRLTITETTPSHPDGLVIHVRPYAQVESTLKAAGFSRAEFQPFEIPIDLPMAGHEGDPITYTVRAEAGKRLQFRGVLAQPWCHLIARR